MKWLWRGLLALILLPVIGLGIFAFVLGPADPPPFVEKAADPKGRPNILLLLVEDLSPRWGAFGDGFAQTPNIDALAMRGTRYPNTFTTAGVCAPSRAALITGMHQGSTGTQHMRTSTRNYEAVPPKEVKAFPELLRRAGYFTYTDEKLDLQFSGIRAGTEPFSIFNESGSGSDWRDRGDGQPFFGLVNYVVTHETGLFPEWGTWPRSGLHLVIQLYRRHLFGRIDELDAIDPASVPLPPYMPDLPEVRRDLARHYANIARLDKQIGETLARLEEDGLSDNTIIILTTDHGDPLPRGKRELYDTGIRVPMIVVWPDRYRPAGAAPGSTDERLVSFVDLAPTLLDFADVRRPGFLQGENFVDGPHRRYIYAARDRVDDYENRQRAVRDARFKLIVNDMAGEDPPRIGGHPGPFRDHLESVRAMRKAHEEGKLNPDQARWFEPTPPEELYDLATDPYELHNLARNPLLNGVRHRLRSALSDWRTRMGPFMEMDEDAMMAEMLNPDGSQKKTPPPTLAVMDGNVGASAQDNASIGYRVGTGPWQLYTRPVALADGLEFKAERYGWAQSETVSP